MTGPVLVLHTTESDTLAPAAAWMLRNQTMSHRIHDPLTGQTQQLVPWDQPARSLRNLTGGVETNRRPGVYQLEIVGWAAQTPAYGPLWYQALANEIIRICDQLNIPKTFPCPFKPYPASAGTNNGIRLTGPQWLEASGIIGHCHVPENTHGDPGDITALIPLIQTPQGAPMDRTTAERTVTALYRAILWRDPDPGGLDNWAGALTRGMTLNQFLWSFIEGCGPETQVRRQQLTTLTERVTDLETRLATTTTTTVEQVLTAIATRLTA